MSLLQNRQEIHEVAIRQFEATHDSLPVAVMVVEISNFLNRVEAAQFTIFTQKFHNSVSKTIRQFNGKVVQNDNNTYQVLFDSVSDAVLCGLQIQYKFKYVTPKHQVFKRRLKIAIHPFSSENSRGNALKDAMDAAVQMCELVKDSFVISSEIKLQYESENQNAKIDPQLIRALKPSEENFLTQLLDHIQSNWNASQFNVEALSKGLGLSRSQLYWRMIRLTGKSPNSFIREYRLHKALLMLHRRKGNISNVAEVTGFKNPSYFTKCFFRKYGILPSKYVQQHVY